MSRDKMSPDKMSPDKMPLLKMPPDKLSPIPKCLLPKCHPTNCLLWQNVSPFKNVSWGEFQLPASKRASRPPLKSALNLFTGPDLFTSGLFLRLKSDAKMDLN
jgi:hypothetical protein